MEKAMVFKPLNNKMVKINHGGSESKSGKIIAVKNDYIALLTKNDGVVYFQTIHIRSVTENVKHNYELDDMEFDMINHLPDDFESLLASCKYDWLRVNGDGHDNVKGVMNKVKDGVLTLVYHKLVIRIFIDHISHVSIGVKPKDD